MASCSRLWWISNTSDLRRVSGFFKELSAFAWKAERVATGCVLFLLVFLPALFGISEPIKFRMSGLVSTWKAAFVAHDLFTSQQTDSAISTNNLSVRPGLPLETSCLWSCISTARKLLKLSVLSLLVTNYSSVYLFIYLCILSIYWFNYIRGGRSLLPKSTLPGWRLLLNLGDPF